MSGLLTICVVRTAHGFVGQSFQDRWNLRTLAEANLRGNPFDINRCVTAGRIDNYRRTAAKMGFRIKICRDQPLIMDGPPPCVGGLSPLEVCDVNHTPELHRKLAS